MNKKMSGYTIFGIALAFITYIILELVYVAITDDSFTLFLLQGDFSSLLFILPGMVLPSLFPFFVSHRRRSLGHPIKTVILSVMSIIVSVFFSFIILLLVGLIYALIKYPFAQALAIVFLIGGIGAAMEPAMEIFVIFFDP